MESFAYVQNGSAIKSVWASDPRAQTLVIVYSGDADYLAPNDAKI
jgi:hypothetical protein